MGVIIGAATVTGIDGSISAQWGVQAQMSRLWNLGSWTPYKTVVTKIETVSITAYAGAGPSITLTPPAGCSDSGAKFNVSIVPGACGGGGGSGITGSFYLMSYSYSKGDPIALAQESYSGQRWPDGGGSSGDVEYVAEPSLVLQGPSEGSATGLGTSAVTFAAGPTVEGSQGSVSAGFPGLGQSDETTYGIISKVGGGTLKSDGDVGQANASVPHQPLYI